MLLHYPTAAACSGRSHVVYPSHILATTATIAEQSGRYCVTRRADSHGGQYFSSIERFALLTREEEQFYARRLRNGEAAARETMMLSNQRLVISQARRFRGRGLSLLDLIAEGNLGLLQAIDNYQLEHQVKFSTYAVPWVRQAMRRALMAQQHSLRIPYRVSLQICQLKKLQKSSTSQDISLFKLGRKLGLKPGAQQRLEAGLALTRLDFDEAQIRSNWQTDAQQPQPDCPQRKILEHADTKLIARLLDSLAPVERSILRLRFGLCGEREHNLEQTARILGFSREKVRRRQQLILLQLKQLLEQQGIDAKVLFHSDLQ